MGPAFGFMLIVMLALLTLTSITGNSNSFLITDAIKALDKSFSVNSIRDIQPLMINKVFFTGSGSSEDLPW